MPRHANRVVLTFTDGSANQLTGAEARLFQELMIAAIDLLPEEEKFKFHNLPWQTVKVTVQPPKKRD